jgi:hypothetical protein
MATSKPAKTAGRTKRHPQGSSLDAREKSWRPTDDDEAESDGTVDAEQELDTDKYEGISPKAWT